MTKLKNKTLWQHSNCDKSQHLKMWQNSKTQIMTKLKKPYCDKTQKHKLWQNSATQIVTKLKTQIVTKQKRLSKKTWKIQLWTKLKKILNCDKTKKKQIVTKLIK